MPWPPACRRLWLAALLANVGPGRLGSAAARRPAPCRARFEPPEPEARASDLNGVRLPDVCINSTGEHHVFVIGDWGGHWVRGADGERHLQPADNRKKGIHSRVYVEGIDDSAQQKVRDQMVKAATEVDIEYVLNVGDNFYWSGVNAECGQTRGASNFSAQWEDIFEGMYAGPGLDGKQWLGVLGNHDWGGYMFNQGWDQTIMYTWQKPAKGGVGRWVTPAMYWRSRVQYSDFSVDYFFMDSNVFDGNETWHNVDHNICGYAHNPVDARCAKEGGPESLLSCPTWFRELWDEQKEWLKWGLMESTTDWQVVVTHFPPVYGKEFWQRMSTNHGIDLIVSGHLHRQEVHYDGPENFLRPTAWLVSGGGGGVTSDFVPSLDGDDQYGFMHLTLSRQTIKVRNIAHTGETRTEVDVAPRPCKKCYGYDPSKLKVPDVDGQPGDEVQPPTWLPRPDFDGQPDIALARMATDNAAAAARAEADSPAPGVGTGQEWPTAPDPVERRAIQGGPELPAKPRGEGVPKPPALSGPVPCMDVSPHRWLDPGGGSLVPCGAQPAAGGIDAGAAGSAAEPLLA